MSTDRDILHATTVSVDGKGVIIIGPSGSGKSSLGIELITRGACLVADDRTEVWREGSQISARAPEPIKGLIEARGVGLVRIPALDATVLSLVIDLGHSEQDRLPRAHHADILGQQLPCLHKADTPHFPSAVLLYIKGNL